MVAAEINDGPQAKSSGPKEAEKEIIIEHATISAEGGLEHPACA